MRGGQDARNGDSSSADEEEEDRLKDIHHHLSKTQSSSSTSNITTSWLPLESNPTVFTSYARSTAHLPQCWEFVDVLGIGGDNNNDNLLLLSPSESVLQSPIVCAGAILLFPTTEAIYNARSVQKARLRKEDQAYRHNNVMSQNVFHLEQVKSFGNACGTIAATHVLLNTGLALESVPDPFNNNSNDSKGESPLSLYKNACKSNGADNQAEHDSLRRERGERLVQTQAVHSISDCAAQNRHSQTQCPESGDTYLGHHYCCFVPVTMGDGRVHVVELDGTKIRPVDHGPIVERSNNSSGSNAFLCTVASIVKRQWMDLEPNRIDFSLMALVKKE